MVTRANAFANRVTMTVSGTPGTGTITLLAAVSPDFGTTELTSGSLYSYTLDDGSNTATGVGLVVNTSGTWTLARDAAERGNVAGTPQSTPISLTSAAIVRFAGILANDIGMLPSLRAPYLGQVATACYIPTATNSSYHQLMSQSFHWSRDNVPFKIGFVGAYFDNISAGEHALGAASPITMAVEYPIGTILWQATFAGSTSGSVPANTSSIYYSDYCPSTIPIGALFAVRVFLTNTVGIPYCAFAAAPTNVLNKMTFAASGLSDQTMSGTVANTSAGVFFTPVSICGMTTKKSFYLEDDSRGVGYYDTTDDFTNDTGQFARFIGPRYAYINGGITGVAASQEASNFNLRKQLAATCWMAQNGLGINDLINGDSAATAMTNRAAVDALLAAQVQSGRVVGTTLFPATTGAWGSLAAQTLASYSTARNTFNGTLRTGGSSKYMSDLLDLDYIVDPSNTGKWPVGYFPGSTAGDAWTADGLHSNNIGSKAMRARTAYNFAGLGD